MWLNKLILTLKIFLKEYLFLSIYNRKRYAPRKLVSIREYLTRPSIYKFKISEIIPGYISKLALDKKIFDIGSEEFSYNEETNIDPIFFAYIPQGRIMTDGSDLAIIDKEKNLLANFSLHFEENLSQYAPEKNNFFNKKLYFEPSKVKGNIFSMYAGGGGNNYFHFLFDSLPTLKILQNSGLKESVDFYYLHETAYSFQKEALSFLGIEDSKIIEATKFPHLSTEYLFCTTHVNHPIHIPGWIIQFLRDSFLKFKNEKKGYEKIFLSRKDSGQRKLLNEEEVFGKLEKLGFIRLELSKLNFIDQVSIFAIAEIVISPHGAGLSNLVFGNKNCKVIELFSGKNEWPLYHALAIRMGMQYHFLTASEIKNNNKRNYSDFSINPEEIIKII
ncbi:MAG: hypothetical protein POELPBGB_00109 [Bacteroidia bacterium]|nr:hypothetical protein [Bacteroidia bacterium]